MKRLSVLLLLVMLHGSVLWAETDAYGIVYNDSLPSFLIGLRDAVYEQKLGVEGIIPLYNQAKGAANSLSGTARLIALSRCEYYLGRSYAYYKQSEPAMQCYQNGMDLAQQSLDLEKTADGWAMLGTNLSELCTLKPKTWVMTNGLKVMTYANNALRLDPKNAIGKYLNACRWAYAPFPLGDPGKGEEMLEAMLDGKTNLQKHDLFDVYTGLAYACNRQFGSSHKREAAEWLDKALKIYPSNKFAGEELKGQLVLAAQ
jgi:tetratricopeptide (TPR) repeat protein